MAPSPGQLTRTNPALADTDGDGRNDNVEINIPWNVTVFGGSPRQVFSHPRFADHDNDGLNDSHELARGTDPENSDTDGDNRLDGAEITAGLNPLRKDKRLNVTMNSYYVDGDCDNAIAGT